VNIVLFSKLTTKFYCRPKSNNVKFTQILCFISIVPGLPISGHARLIPPSTFRVSGRVMRVHSIKFNASQQ